MPAIIPADAPERCASWPFDSWELFIFVWLLLFSFVLESVRRVGHAQRDDFEIPHSRGVCIFPAAELCQPNNPSAHGSGGCRSHDHHRHRIHDMSTLLPDCSRQDIGLG